MPLLFWSTISSKSYTYEVFVRHSEVVTETLVSWILLQDSSWCFHLKQTISRCLDWIIAYWPKHFQFLARIYWRYADQFAEVCNLIPQLGLRLRLSMAFAEVSVSGATWPLCSCAGIQSDKLLANIPKIPCAYPLSQNGWLELVTCFWWFNWISLCICTFRSSSELRPGSI